MEKMLNFEIHTSYMKRFQRKLFNTKVVAEHIKALKAHCVWP